MQPAGRATAHGASTPGESIEAARPYRFARVPSEDLAPILFMHRHVPVELDGVAHIQPLYLPRIAKVEPVVWLLVLESIHNCLRTAQCQVRQQPQTCRSIAFMKSADCSSYAKRFNMMSSCA